MYYENGRFGSCTYRFVLFFCTNCRGDHRSPVFAMYRRATDGRPCKIAETVRKPHGCRLSPTASKPSPVGKA